MLFTEDKIYQGNIGDIVYVEYESKDDTIIELGEITEENKIRLKRNNRIINNYIETYKP